MNSSIHLRACQPSDGTQIGRLIYDTVRTVNRKHYSEEQVSTWAPDPILYSTYEDSYVLVAEQEGTIVGFGNLSREGYLHRLYVHKDFQRHGIGSLLLDALEAKARELGLSEITTESSITAKPFFLAKGFVVLSEQIKVLRGVSFINYKMHKNL